MRRVLAIGFSSLLLLHRVVSDHAAVPSKDSSGSSLSSGQRFVVDDDSVQCPSADFTTIGEAVDVASSGDTILVCAGNYPEAVAITGES
jgi:pectin methylesterase-like acyl-CoA thioesterase